MFRFPTRWAEDDPARVRLALLMLLSLRGTPVLYQGDEIGMGNVAVAQEDLRDPLGVRFYPYYEGRDAGRTPMQWSDRPGGGFTDGTRPWLPLGDLAAASVDAQRDDPRSVLSLCRDLIAFRRGHPAFSTGDTTTVPTPDAASAWAWTRGERYVVALNMSAEPLVLPGLSGTIRISTDRTREHEAVGGDLRLAPFDGVILERI
jgi:alpha-glucosidase